VDRYVIYREDDPAVEPADSIGFTAGTAYTDPGAAGATGTNYTYIVRAASDAKGKSAPSNRVGEFDIDLGNDKKAATGQGEHGDVGRNEHGRNRRDRGIESARSR
jgi:hypothetical protein